MEKLLDLNGGTGEYLKDLRIDWKQYAVENEDEQCKYTRNRLYQNSNGEVLLIVWKRGQGSPIHGHGGGECYVKILNGGLKETVYKNDGSFVENVYSEGDITHINDTMGVHSMNNVSYCEIAVSLHVYIGGSEIGGEVHRDYTTMC